MAHEGLARTSAEWAVWTPSPRHMRALVRGSMLHNAAFARQADSRTDAGLQQGLPSADHDGSRSDWNRAISGQMS
jgi:hypothetical protein